MFPFKWNYKAKDKPLHELDFEQRTNTDKFTKFLLNGEWVKPDPMFTCGVEDYNKYVYFYEYARQVIFDLGNAKNKSKSSVYEFSYKRTGDFILTLKDGKKYVLKIDAIKLKVYKTGVAILSYHLANYQYSSSDDILKINDFGRRVYPQFLKESDLGDSYIHKAQNYFLPFEVELELNGKTEPIKEDFTHFNGLNLIRDNPTKVSRIITDLLGDKFKNGLKENVQVGEIHINPVIDDRMFVLSWYGNNDLSGTLKKFDSEKEEYYYSKSDFWYQYVFVDGNSKTCESKIMIKNLLEESTYDRWVDYGTLFGLSSYSFVALTDKSGFGENTLVPHLKLMYYEMVALSLAQRASILCFSEEVSFVSDVKDSRVTQRVRELHKHYIDFVNRMYFKEISSQEQGIELYGLMQEKMKISQGVETLEKEISELHQYATLIEERKNSDSLDLIAILGALFVIPSFITGFFGMNLTSVIDLFDKWFAPSICNGGFKLLWKWLFSCISIPGLVIISLFVLYRKTFHKKFAQFFIKVVLYITILIFLIFPIVMLIITRS